MRVSEIRVKQIRVNQGLGVRIFENNFTDFLEVYSLSKTFEIVWDNTLKCSDLINF